MRSTLALLSALLGITQALGAQDQALAQKQTAEWEAATRANPSDFASWAALGSAYGKQGRLQDALGAFNRAITANPKYAEAYLGLASTYGSLGRTEDKITFCRKAIALKSDYAEAYGNLGSALGRSGRYKEAVVSLKEAVRLNPKLADAHFALGLAYLSLDDKPAAQLQVGQLTPLSPALSKQLQQLISK